jgi:putative phosphoribosyl transferase
MAAPIFRDRSEAGRELASALRHLRHSHPIVMGVPRSGVLVAAEVAPVVRGVMDLMIVRRIAAPGRPDATVGAILDGAQLEIFCDEDAMAAYRMSQADFDAEVGRLRYDIALQQNRYAASRPRSNVQNHAVVLAEDTIVTGATARVAARALYKQSVRHVAIAAPVALRMAAETMRDECDELIVLAEVEDLDAARAAYADFRPATGADVIRLMRAMPAPNI